MQIEELIKELERAAKRQPGAQVVVKCEDLPRVFTVRAGRQPEKIRTMEDRLVVLEVTA